MFLPTSQRMQRTRPRLSTLRSKDVRCSHHPARFSAHSGPRPPITRTRARPFRPPDRLRLPRSHASQPQPQRRSLQTGWAPTSRRTGSAWSGMRPSLEGNLFEALWSGQGAALDDNTIRLDAARLASDLSSFARPRRTTCRSTTDTKVPFTTTTTRHHVPRPPSPSPVSHGKPQAP